MDFCSLMLIFKKKKNPKRTIGTDQVIGTGKIQKASMLLTKDSKMSSNWKLLNKLN